MVVYFVIVRLQKNSISPCTLQSSHVCGRMTYHLLITSNLHACQSYVHQELSCMHKPYITWPLRAEHPSSTSLTNSYIVQGLLVYLYIDSAACKKYCYGLLDLSAFCEWCALLYQWSQDHWDLYHRPDMSLFIHSTLTPTQQPYVTSTLCTLLVWPFSRLSVWLFRCFYIASGSHPDHISLLLHHSRHSG